MKVLKLGMVLVFILLITIAVLANVNNKDFYDEIIIEDGLKTYREEVCVDNFGNRTCVENTYVECNGETYNVPKPTGFTIYRTIIEKEYIEMIVKKVNERNAKYRLLASKRRLIKEKLELLLFEKEIEERVPGT